MSMYIQLHKYLYPYEALSMWFLFTDNTYDQEFNIFEPTSPIHVIDAKNSPLDKSV